MFLKVFYVNRIHECLPDCFREIVCLIETSVRQGLRRMSPKYQKSKLFWISLSFWLVTISPPDSTFHWFSLIEDCCRLVACLHTISVLSAHCSQVPPVSSLCILSTVCFGVRTAWPQTAGCQRGLVCVCGLSLTWDWGNRPGLGTQAASRQYQAVTN